MSLKRYVKTAIMMLKKEKKIAIPIPVDTAHLLQDKVALITGGSGGIGMAIAQSFLRSGCKVIVTGTNEEKLKKFVAEGGAKPMVLNVLDVEMLPGKISSAVELFEEKRIDILVNCAGVVNSSTFFDTTEDEYDKIMDINAKGTFFMSQAVGKYMIAHKIKGHILNVSSSSALRPAWTPYQMSKWAVKGFTMGLADILIPYGIVVNAIAPGPTATSMIGVSEQDGLDSYGPAGRLVHPDEVAALATFMVSDLGNMIIGDTIYMTGGSGTITYHR